MFCTTMPLTINLMINPILLILLVSSCIVASSFFDDKDNDVCTPKHFRLAPGSPASSSMTISFTLKFETGVLACKPHLLVGSDEQDGYLTFDRVLFVDESSDVRQVRYNTS